MVALNEINSVTDLVTGATNEPAEKMTYNEWRQIRKRRKMLYKAPVCMTRLESMVVQPGYNIKLSIVITGFPVPSVIWLLDNEEIENDNKFTIEHNEKEGTYSLLISQISPHESGCYQCYAENSEGADSTIAFVKVKETRNRRKRSVSQRPHISTIREWKSREEAEKVDRDPQEERQLLRNRQCWDWWNLSAASDDERRGDRERSCDSLDLLDAAALNKTEQEWEKAKNSQKRSLIRSRSRSLPPDSRSSAPAARGKPAENKLKKLKSFWESKRHR